MQCEAFSVEREVNALPQGGQMRDNSGEEDMEDVRLRWIRFGTSTTQILRAIR